MTTETEPQVSQELKTGSEYITGWGLFAGMLIFGISLFSFSAMCVGWGSNILQYTAFGRAVDWLWYGIFDGLTALVAFFAGAAIFQGRKIGYYLGLIMATLSAGRWFLFIPAIPFWGVTMVVIWILAVYGLIQDRKAFK